MFSQSPYQPATATPDPCTVMDQALSCLNMTTLVNLELLETLVTITQHRYKAQGPILQSLYHLQLNVRDNEKQSQQQLESIIGHQRNIPSDLFRRFYNRLNEKLLVKLLHYDMNHQSLKWMSQGLVELLSCCPGTIAPSPQHTFDKFTSVMQKLRLQNKTLIKMLLELIVDKGMVCSQEEFAIVMAAKYGHKAKGLSHKRMGVLEMAAKKKKKMSRMSSIIQELRVDAREAEKEGGQMWSKFRGAKEAATPHNRVYMTGYFWHRRSTANSQLTAEQIQQEVHKKDNKQNNKPKPAIPKSSPVLLGGFITEVKENGENNGGVSVSPQENLEVADTKTITTNKRKGKNDWSKVKSRYMNFGIKDKAKQGPQIVSTDKQCKKQQVKIITPVCTTHRNTTAASSPRFTTAANSPRHRPFHRRKARSVTTPPPCPTPHTDNTPLSPPKPLQRFYPSALSPLKKPPALTSQHRPREHHSRTLQSMVSQIINQEYLTKVAEGGIDPNKQYEIRVQCEQMGRKGRRALGWGLGNIIWPRDNLKKRTTVDCCFIDDSRLERQSKATTASLYSKNYDAKEKPLSAPQSSRTSFYEIYNTRQRRVLSRVQY